MSEPTHEIIYRKLSGLKKLPNNPRIIKKEDMERLKTSVKNNPDYFEARPLILSNRTGELVILAGNQRYEAAKALGLEEVPTVLLEGLTEEREKEIIIRDNVSNGDWDYDALANEFEIDDLEEWGAPVDWEEEPAEAVEDEAPEVDETAPVESKLGEIYQLGGHRLMCGDSTDAASVALLMNGEKADMVFTDPPYGVSYTEKNKFLNSLGKPMAFPKAIENDSKAPEEMYEFWVKCFSLLHQFSKDTMAYYVTAPQGGDLLLLLLQALRDSGFMLKHQLVWNKNNHVLGRCDYNYKHEPIIYGWKIGKKHNFYGKGKFKTSVWDIPKPLKNDLHPTMKPVELVVNAELDATKEGDIVLDLFGGSGTALIASEQTGRKCYMMELDPKYCDVIRKRYWKFVTGSEEGWQDGTKAVA